MEGVICPPVGNHSFRLENRILTLKEIWKGRSSLPDTRIRICWTKDSKQLTASLYQSALICQIIRTSSWKKMLAQIIKAVLQIGSCISPQPTPHVSTQTSHHWTSVCYSWIRYRCPGSCSPRVLPTLELLGLGPLCVFLLFFQIKYFVEIIFSHASSHRLLLWQY